MMEVSGLLFSITVTKIPADLSRSLGRVLFFDIAKNLYGQQSDR
jgi:hypothetical protein